MRSLLFLCLLGLLVSLDLIAGQRYDQAHRNQLYESIEMKFNLIDEFSKSKFDWYTDRKWGIASLHLYNKTKTLFMFNNLLNYDQEGGASGKIKTVCELGFNAGHSALLVLETLQHAQVYSFDLGDAPFTEANSARMQSIYKERFTYIKGDSMETIPLYQNKNISCDAVFADGAKDFQHRYKDIKNFRALSSHNALVFMDEICTPECAKGEVVISDPKCYGGIYGHNCRTTKAYNQLVHDGILKVKSCIETTTVNDGFCLGFYVA